MVIVNSENTVIEKNSGTMAAIFSINLIMFISTYS